MGYPQADAHALWLTYSALNRRLRRAILMRARKRVAPGLSRGSHEFELALRRQVVELMREEPRHEPDSASHLFEVLRGAG